MRARLQPWSMIRTTRMIAAIAGVGRWMPFLPIVNLLGRGKFRPKGDIHHSSCAWGHSARSMKERSLLQPIRGVGYDVGSLSLRPLICQILQFRKITGAIYRRYDEVLRPSMEVASPADSRQQQVARSCHCRTAFGHAQLPSRGRSSTVRTVVRADTRHTNPTVAGSSPRLRSEMARCARSHLAAVAWV